jgi:C4-dicarboxylate-specific signal transduction histidine kinase
MKTMRKEPNNSATITQTNFRFSTNILRRLGEELNPSPSQGIIELAKNAYDADALHCTISLNDTYSPGGTIVIDDDGDGMNVEEIINGWLVLGKSKKVMLRDLTRLGRKPSGDKGLGRLSALRMGNKVSLKSIPRDNPTAEHTLVIDWDRYKDDSLVEDIDLKIETTMNLAEKKPGTLITLQNLRPALKQNEIQRLARGLILLADPFGDNPQGFSPVLKAPEYESLETMVAAKYFNDAEYHLVANLDETGFAEASVKDWRGEILFSAKHDDLRPKDKAKPYRCPKASFDLWVFLLTKKFTARIAPQSEIQKWLSEFGGVHLYYNGLRVAPYGDKGDDWLGMNLMRARSPEERPSTNTSVGRIIVTEKEKTLLQKTDRSGFIIDDVFQELQLFAQDSLNWMSRRRMDEAEKKRRATREEAPKKSEKEKTTVQQAIQSVPEEKRKEVESAFAKYDKARESEVSELKKEVQLYRTLSTVGITAAVFAHESGNNPLKLIEQSIGTVQRRCKTYLGENYEQHLKDPIERIQQSTKSLRVLTDVTLSLVDHEKRRAGRVEIHQVIKGVIDLYSPFIRDRDVKVEQELCEGNPYLRGSIAAIESIVTNFLNNSLIIFESKSPGERKIIIRTKIMNNSELELRVLDNGPGIEGIDKNDIWLPGQTTRLNGTGLGLTIVKDAVTDLGGRVDAIEKGDLGGAEMIVVLPILGV